MSHPSQVSMSELQSFMTPAFIINAFQKLGHHPISANITKKRKGDDKEICIIQFANEDAAKQAVLKLNGKLIPSSSFNAGKFKLSQCIGNRTAEHNVWVGDLTLDVDDYHFFKFFADRFKTLCNAKVILDTRGVSRGYGFLKFSSEDEQKQCLKTMSGSLGLGCRPIKVSPVNKGHPQGSSNSDTGSDDYGKDARLLNGDPWCKYTSWNQFVEPVDYSFVAVKVKLASAKENDSSNELQLVGTLNLALRSAESYLKKNVQLNHLSDYNVSSHVDDLNTEILERDCHLWDALECSKWLPEMALTTPKSSKS